MCCLFGIIDYKNIVTHQQKIKLLRKLALCCEERGTDAAGIAYNVNSSLNIVKKGVPAHRLKYSIPGSTKVIMGHTRLATQGSERKVYNNHPFYGKCNGESFALAHNGIINNDFSLRKELNLPKTKIETDSYIAVQLIEKEGAVNTDTIRKMSETVEGSFCFTVLDSQDNLYIVKGDNPMCLYNIGRLGIYVYASTEKILKNALKICGLKRECCEEINLNMGNIIKISSDGDFKISMFDTEKIGLCIWNSCSNFFWDDCCLPKKKNSSALYDYLVEYASYAGINEDEINMLIDCGNGIREIEDMLMNPELLNEVLLCGY